MAINKLTTRIVLRNDTTQGWSSIAASEDYKLLKGEVGIEFTESGKVKMKIGNGASTWAQLPYFGGDECKVTEIEIAKGTAHSTELNKIAAPNKGDIAIVKEAIIAADNLTTGVTQQYQYTAYVYGETANGDEWKAMDGNYSADNVYFNDDFTFTTNIGTVTGVTSSKKVAAAGKSVKQFFSGLFAQEVHVTDIASADQPKTSITLKNGSTEIKSNTSYEVGTSVSPSYVASFADGKYTYGPEPTGVTVSSWEVSSTTGGSWSTATGADTTFIVGDDTSYNITAKANHTEGSPALSNIGNPGTYKFAEGSKSATTYTISGYRAQFYGAKVENEKIALTSDGIRTLTACKPGNTFSSKYTENKSKNGFQITIPEGCKQVVIALCGKTLKNVYDHAAFGTDIIGSFVEVSATTPISVAGTNSYTSVNYKVYVFSPDAALGANTYDVIIG